MSMKSIAATMTGLLVVGTLAAISCRPRDDAPSPRNAEPVDGHQRMVQLLASRRETSLATDRLFGDRDLREAEAVLRRPHLSDWERFGACYIAGVASKRLGDYQQAISYLREAYELILEIPRSVTARLP